MDDPQIMSWLRACLLQPTRSLRLSMFSSAFSAPPQP